MCFFLSHSFAALTVCFGSLSCWNIHQQPIFSVLAETKRFSLKVSLYLTSSIFPSTRYRRHVLSAEKQPQSIMFLPPYLMAGMAFLGSKSAFFLLQTRQVRLMPKSPILVSSYLQTSDGPVYVPYWEGDLAGTTWFQSATTLCVTNGHLGDCGPSYLEIINKLLPQRSGWFLHLSHHQVYSTLGDLSLSVNWCFFHFPIIPTKSWFLLT